MYSSCRECTQWTALPPSYFHLPQYRQSRPSLYTRCDCGVHLLGGENAFPRGAEGSCPRAAGIASSHPLNAAAVIPLPPPRPVPPPPAAVELNGVAVDDSLLPPRKVQVKLNEGRKDGSLPPTPTVRVEDLNGVQEEDFLPPPRAVKKRNMIYDPRVSFPVEQFAEPTISVPPSISPVIPPYPCLYNRDGCSSSDPDQAEMSDR